MHNDTHIYEQFLNLHVGLGLDFVIVCLFRIRIMCVCFCVSLSFLANVNVLRYVCYMLSAVRLSSVCLSVVCDVGAPYSGG